MAPEGYELIKYTIQNDETWVIKDKDGNIWFPISEIFRNLFKFNINITLIKKELKKHTIRLRMTTPRKKLSYVAPENQPKDVIIFGDFYCIKDLVRTRIKMTQDPEQRQRDIIVEEFAKKWEFRLDGYGTLTNIEPYWENYPIADKLAIVVEPNRELWSRCTNCEMYYPFTNSFFRNKGSVCRKCKGTGFKFDNPDAYNKIKEYTKNRYL